MATITIIGAGKVARQLGRALFEAGHELLQIYNRTPEKAELLAKAFQAEAIDQLSQVNPNADVYLIAVKDDAIKPIAAALSQPLKRTTLVVHTSGATPSTLLQPYFNYYGVFYPLQTFSAEKEMDFKTIPMCIFSNSAEHQNQLFQLGKSISNRVCTMNDQARSTLHVAAVFANNFTNHLLHIAEDLLQDTELPFELLLPLIEETIAKVKVMSPQAAQTGPAKRQDQLTIKKHLQLLANHPQYRAVYEVITESIAMSNEQ